MICGHCNGSGFSNVNDLLRHQDDCYTRGWQEVINLRHEKRYDEADRKARKLMGIKSEPMSEETKEKLREYYEEHKEEIAETNRIKRQIKKSMKKRIAQNTKKLNKKKG